VEIPRYSPAARMASVVAAKGEIPNSRRITPVQAFLFRTTWGDAADAYSDKQNTILLINGKQPKHRFCVMSIVRAESENIASGMCPSGHIRPRLSL